MTAITWTGNAGDGNFNNAANWSPQQVPGAGDTVTISPSAVTAIGVANDAVGSLTTSSTVTLNVAGGTGFTIGNGSGNTTFSNGGTLNLNSNGYGTYLYINAPQVTLSGGGVIAMTSNGNNFIEGDAASDVLINSNNTIEGEGNLGAGQLTFTNGASGKVIANNATSLTLNTGANLVTNSGLMESTSTGGFYIDSSVNNGTTGKLTAASGNIYLQSGASIDGGTITTTGTGAFVAYSGALNGTAQTVTIAAKSVVDVAGGDQLELLGTITNKATINVQTNGYGTYLLASGTVTLTGGGVIAMTDGGNNFIEGNSSADVLDNLNNIIEGAGQLGNGQTTIINAASGIIDANAVNTALTVNTSGATLANSGLIEATGTGGMAINSTVVDSHTGGEILANASTVTINATSLAGGTIATTNGGIISSVGGTLDGTAHALTSTATVDVYGGQSMTLLGSIVNDGSINLESNGYGTGLYIGPGGTTPGTVTLTGTGTITMNDNANNFIYGNIAGDELLNQTNTIEGSGLLGDGQLVFVNDATVDATGTASGLTLSTGGEQATNNGLMEATGSAGFAIQNTVVANASGTIDAAGGNVYLVGGTVAGGLIESSTGLAIVAPGGNTGTLDGSASAVTNTGSVDIYQSGVLNLLGSIVNDGSINLESGGYNTDLIIDSAKVTLSGAGTITLSNNGNNEIYGASGSDVLDNVNNTITGAGALGSNQLTITNGKAGVINASQTTSLVVQTGGSVLTNDGLMESTSTGGLVILSTDIANATGTMSAAGGDIYLQGGTITGGALDSSGGGALVVQGGETGTLDGSATAITLAGTLDLNQSGVLDVLGSIVNEGTINEQSGGYNTDLVVSSSVVTFTGGGDIVLTDNGNNAIYGASGADELDNFNNTIEGAGQLGANQMTLLNGTAGVIDATSTTALVIQTGSDSFTNDGLVESTGTGGLTIQSTDVLNASGTISAAGSNVSLQGATISGGLLTGAGAFNIYGGQSATLDGSASTLTNASTVDVNQSGVLYLVGAIANQGSINVESGGYGTDLIINSAKVTLSGGGVLAMSDNGNNFLYGAATADILDNVNNTIEGSGQLGDGQLTLQNYGTIEATGATSLAINLGSTGINETTGKWIGIGSGGLQISNGTYTNNGLIEAENGSSVVFQSNATLTNFSNGTLTGGTYEAVDGGNGAVVDLSGGAITTLAATVILSGADSVLEGNGSSIDATLTTVSKTGVLEVENGRTFTEATALTNLSKGTLTAGTYEAVGAGSAINLDGSAITTLAATVILSGAGAVVEAKGISLASTLTTISTSGELEIENGQIYTGAKALTDDGIIALAGGTLAGAVVTVYPSGTLTGNGKVTAQLKAAGVINASGGTLDIAGGGGSEGKIKGSTVDFASKPFELVTGVSLLATTIGVISGGSLLLETSVSYAGTLDIASGSIKDGVAGDSFTNSGSLVQTGASTTATISAPFISTGTITVDAGGALAFTGGLTNTGVIVVNGVFTDTAPLTGGSLTIGGSGAQAQIATGAGSGGSTLSTLTMGGGKLSTSGTTLTISIDYVNSAAGVGNAYTPFADVTGTIDGQGTGLSVVGVDGTTITVVNGVDTITLAPGGTANFVIENSGASGSAELRGALQTSVNGAHVSANLSGSGVTAQNFGPIAGGAESTVYTINYSSGSLGSDAIFIQSDFANVPGVLVDIVKG